MFIQIGNKGQDITYTNYWDHDLAKQGYFYLSWNAGAARLLVPDSRLADIAEMKTGKCVIISRGKFKGKDGLELMFEDNSENPYAIHMVAEQCDRLILEDEQGGGINLVVWTRAGKQLELSAKYRVTKKLPDLSPWSEQ